MTMLPQVLLSGLIFPLASIAAGVRSLSYLPPLTYFNEIARGVMLRAEPIGPLWRPFVFLALLGSGRGHPGDPAVPRLPDTRVGWRRTPPAAPARQGSHCWRHRGKARGSRHEADPRGRHGRTLASPWRYGHTVALEDVSVTVAPGQITAVVGGDGAGKSLLRRLAGAHPTGCRGGAHPWSVADRLPAGQLRHLPRPHRGREPRIPRDRVPDAGGRGSRAGGTTNGTAGLSAARDRLAGQLSGGMRQKLGVIAALLHRPDLLILDEPSTGVDPVSRSGLWSLIASAAADGAAVILATTYLDDVHRASTVLVLDEGRPSPSGRPDHIVAGMPGSVVVTAGEPDGPAETRAWRRGTAWRLWCPPGTDCPADPVAVDLQDAVTVAALARELQSRKQKAAVAPAVDAPSPEVASITKNPRARRRPTGPLAESIAVSCVFGHVTAVRNVSMQVRPGEIVGLLGANGAGKTTLIRMLLGLIPAATGQILLLGEQPSRKTRRRIGYVAQGLGLYDDLTVAENMAFAAAVFGNRPPPESRAGSR